MNDSQCTPPRVAFALGRRNGNAPTRNRLRRQLRALMAGDDVMVRPGLYLVGHKGTIEPYAASALRHELESLLTRVGSQR